MTEKIWRVDVHKQTVQLEEVPGEWSKLGGRALIARIMLDEINPGCDPLGPENKLIYAPGLLVGHMLSSVDRISVGAKSPLTGGIKESNAGGTTGLKLAYLGVKAMIIEGLPRPEGWWLLHLSAEGGRFERMDELCMMGVNQAAKILVERYGSKAGISLIGPGGEMEMYAAGIQNLDKDLVASRINGRGGMGAVLGSKRIKAIVIATGASRKPRLKDPELFKRARRYYTRKLLEHPQTEIYQKIGTSAMVLPCDFMGGLPTRNFSQGRFEDAKDISGETMRELLLSRGGKKATTHACMPGCVVQCSNIYPDEKGDLIVSPVEYETLGLMGSNLGINNLDMIAKLNQEANDLGLDTIEIGAALGVAADGGLWEFGDAPAALALMQEIRAGTKTGRLLGNGAAAIGEALGVERIPVVKGQAFSAYDPRAIKGTGVTYATSPQGADHTAGLTVRANVDHRNPDEQKLASQRMQILAAAWDTLGVCLFGSFGFANAPEAVRDLLRGRYGWDVEDDIVEQLGRMTIELEREYNRRAGFGPEDDRLPNWVKSQPLPPIDEVFDVSDQDLDSVFDW